MKLLHKTLNNKMHNFENIYLHPDLFLVNICACIECLDMMGFGDYKILVYITEREFYCTFFSITRKKII